MFLQTPQSARIGWQLGFKAVVDNAVSKANYCAQGNLQAAVGDKYIGFATRTSLLVLSAKLVNTSNHTLSYHPGTNKQYIPHGT